MQYRQDWINLWLGVWTLFSPFVLGYMNEAPTAMWATWWLGFALILATELGSYLASGTKRILNAAMGLILIASPWIWGFSGTTSARNSLVLVGALVLITLVWSKASNTEVGGAPLKH